MSLTGVVKVFNAFKGFGFITDEAGAEIFLHMQACVDGKVPKGGDVVVYDLVESTVKPGMMQAGNVVGGTGEMPAKGAKIEGTGAHCGTVKNYNDQKGFGFITGSDEKDVFFFGSDFVDGTSPAIGDVVSYDVEASKLKPGSLHAYNLAGGTKPAMHKNDKGKGKDDKGKGKSWGKDPWADDWGKGGKSDDWGTGWGKDPWGGKAADPWGGKAADPWNGKAADPWGKGGKGDDWGKGGWGKADPWAVDPWSKGKGDWGKNSYDPYGGGKDKGKGKPWGGDGWGGKGALVLPPGKGKVAAEVDAPRKQIIVRIKAPGQ